MTFEHFNDQENVDQVREKSLIEVNANEIKYQRNEAKVIKCSQAKSD